MFVIKRPGCLSYSKPQRNTSLSGHTKLDRMRAASASRGETAYFSFRILAYVPLHVLAKIAGIAVSFLENPGNINAFRRQLRGQGNSSAVTDNESLTPAVIKSHDGYDEGSTSSALLWSAAPE